MELSIIDTNNNCFYFVVKYNRGSVNKKLNIVNI